MAANAPVRRGPGRPPREPVSDDVRRQLEALYYQQNNFFGRDRLYQLARQNGIDVSRRQLYDWLSGQEVHQLYMPVKKRKTIKATVVKRPFYQVAMDLADMSSFESNRYKWILTAIDLFSKMGWAYPLRDKTEGSVIAALRVLLADPDFRATRVLRSDNGSEFKNRALAAFLAQRGVRQVFSSADAPQSNGQVERFNRTVKGLIRKYVAFHNRTDWPRQLQQLIDNYNHTVHDTTKKVPIEVAREQDAEALDNTERLLRQRALRRLPGANPRFEVGDLVRIREKTDDRPRLAFTYSRDIYRVASVVVRRAVAQAASYRLEDMDENLVPGLFYDSDLQKVRNVQADNPIGAPRHYEISRLEEPVRLNGRPAYVVRWRGYRRREDLTIEPRDQLLEDAPRVVRAYEQEHQINWNRVRRVRR